MFNGIIFNHGEVTKIDKRVKGVNLFIKSGISIKYNAIKHFKNTLLSPLRLKKF